MRKAALALLTALAMFSCSHPAPPTGRWEGTYETRDTMIAARLEIEADGQVRVSAPDLLDIGASSDEDRPGMRAKLAADLASGWGDVAPRPMDFDGETFRRPGGIAPQMTWTSEQMWLILYLGTQPSVRLKMRKVDAFSDDPFGS